MSEGLHSLRGRWAKVARHTHTCTRTDTHSYRHGGCLGGRGAGGTFCVHDTKRHRAPLGSKNMPGNKEENIPPQRQTHTSSTKRAPNHTRTDRRVDGRTEGRKDRQIDRHTHTRMQKDNFVCTKISASPSRCFLLLCYFQADTPAHLRTYSPHHPTHSHTHTKTHSHTQTRKHTF